jgi:DNA-binding transcriptional MocR family regulator
MPRLTKDIEKQMHIEILTQAFSLHQIGRNFGVSHSTVRRHKKKLEERPDIRTKFQKELHKQMIERDGKSPKSSKSPKKSQGDHTDDTAENIEDATIKRAATRVMDVLARHCEITDKAWTGIQKIQEAINAQANGEEETLDIKFLAQAQRQNSSSIVNIMNADRKSYNIDDPGADEDAPDSIHISFHRDKAPEIEAK